jgi:internalin A
VGWAQKSQRDLLEFEYHYSVLPRGLIPRFIVRTQHLLTDQPTVWRSGAVLSVEGCRVLVRGDLRKAKVFIQVIGPGDHRRRALAVVRDAFAAIHPSYGEMNAEAKVPLPGDPNAPPVDYRYLLNLEKQNVGEYLFEKAQHPYNVSELLDGVDERRFDAFISYSSSDKPAARELTKHLQKYGVRYWFDEQHIRPGQEWQREIAVALRECHTILVLIGSQDVGPWEKEEVSVGLDYAARGKKTVIPVLLPHAPNISDLPVQFDFLRSRSFVDFRPGFTDDEVLRLVNAIPK